MKWYYMFGTCCLCRIFNELKNIIRNVKSMYIIWKEKNINNLITQIEQVYTYKDDIIYYNIMCYARSSIIRFRQSVFASDERDATSIICFLFRRSHPHGFGPRRDQVDTIQHTIYFYIYRYLPDIKMCMRTIILT